MAEIDLNEKNKNIEKEFSSPSEATLYLLRFFSQKYKTPRIIFSIFLSFVKKVLIKYSTQGPGMKSLSVDTETSISHQLEKLCEAKKCILEYTNEKITHIQFPLYYFDMIRAAFTEIENDIQKPFPTEESLGLTIPGEHITALNIKNDFALAIGMGESETIHITRLIFPEGLNPIIITSDLINKKLLQLSAYKIKLYLDIKRNSGYIENRLISIFRQKDIAVREMINRITVRPSFIVSSILEPTEFTFRFWAHFTNVVMKEFMKKDNKLQNEQGYCQAAYLISLYNIYYKGVLQEEKEREYALTILDKKLRRPPYIFSLYEIYSIRDKSGFPIIRKISKQIINEYLKKKLEGGSTVTLPEIIRIRTIRNEEFYIHKSSILPLTLKKIYYASQDLRKAYLSNWVNLLKRHKKSSMMFNDMAFLKNVNLQLKNHFPLLNSLLNYDLLYMARKDIEKDSRESIEISRIFHKKKMMLIPLTEIFGLDRKELLAEAKTHLPVWESIPLLRNIIRLIKKLFLGKKKEEEKPEDPTILPLMTVDSSTPVDTDIPDFSENKQVVSDSEDLDELKPVDEPGRELFKNALKDLKEQLVGQDMNIDEKLESLAEKWNPLFDPTARENLLADVNSIIKDYLRRVKHTLKVQPPDLERIRTLAITLSDNRSFDKILKKEYFLWYIEIYILKLLIEMHIYFR